jgi:hypothetical protein
LRNPGVVDPQIAQWQGVQRCEVSYRVVGQVQAVYLCGCQCGYVRYVVAWHAQAPRRHSGQWPQLGNIVNCAVKAEEVMAAQRLVCLYSHPAQVKSRNVPGAAHNLNEQHRLFSRQVGRPLSKHPRRNPCRWVALDCLIREQEACR